MSEPATKPRLDVVTRLAAHLRTPYGTGAAEQAFLWRCVAEGRHYEPAKAIPTALEAQEAIKAAPSRPGMPASSEASDLEQLASFLQGSSAAGSSTYSSDFADVAEDHRDAVMLQELLDGQNASWESSRSSRAHWSSSDNVWKGWSESWWEGDGSWWQEASWTSGWWEMSTAGSDAAPATASQAQAELQPENEVEEFQSEAEVEFVRMDSDFEDADQGPAAGDVWDLDWNDIPVPGKDNNVAQGDHGSLKVGAQDHQLGKKGKGKGKSAKRTPRKLRPNIQAEKPEDFALWCERHKQPADANQLHSTDTNQKGGKEGARDQHDRDSGWEYDHGRSRRTERGKGKAPVERLDRGGKGKAGKNGRARMAEEAAVNYAFVIDQPSDGQKFRSIPDQADETDSQPNVQIDCLGKKADMLSTSQPTSEKIDILRARARKG